MKLTCLAALAALLALPAEAAVVSPLSYSMPNGGNVYRDQSYMGSGSSAVTGNPGQSGSPLSGGKGDLTDGYIEPLNFNAVENGTGTGPYVAWQNFDPVITFFFASAQTFSRVTFHFDDSNGRFGVSPPVSVSINGVSSPVTDPASDAPFAFVVDMTGRTPTDQLSVQLFRQTEWLFLSEVTFEADMPSVPLPAGLPLLAGGLGLLALMRRRA